MRPTHSVCGARLDRHTIRSCLTILPLQEIGELALIEFHRHPKAGIVELPVDECRPQKPRAVLYGIMDIDLFDAIAARCSLKSVANSLGPTISHRPNDIASG